MATTTAEFRRDPQNEVIADSPERLGELLSYLAYALFVITNILSICAVKLGVWSLPFRMWTLLGAGVLLLASDRRLIRRAVDETVRLLLFITAVAVLGFLVSVIAHAPVNGTIRQVIEIHVQAVVAVVIGYALMLRFGVPRTLYAFLIAYGITAIFAVGQTLHIDAAWRVREAIAQITKDSIFNLDWYDPRQRAMGLSYTPVLFATQTCVALAACVYIRIAQGSLRKRRFDWALAAVTVVLLGLCVITGNRSPTLGIAAFVLVFILFRWPKFGALLLPLALIVAGIAAVNQQMLAETGLRVLRTSNSSSQNRNTLRAYGLFLVERRPIGYGLTFESTKKWPVFFQQSVYMPNPNSIRNWALHNYYLNILTKYGILILFLLPWILPRRREQLILWMAFVPYMVHIFYHNDGPLQGDVVVFFTFAAAMVLMRRPELFTNTPLNVRPNPWRRAFQRDVLVRN